MSIINIIAIITLIINTLVFLATAFMTSITWKNMSILATQIRSQAQGNIFEAHKNLYMEILKNDELCKIVSNGNSYVYRQNMLGSILINHCARIFSDYNEEILCNTKFNDFIKDVDDLFKIKIVRDRWESVREFHSERFRLFIDTKILRTSLYDKLPKKMDPSSSD